MDAEKTKLMTTAKEPVECKLKQKTTEHEMTFKYMRINISNCKMKCKMLEVRGQGQ